VAEALHAILIVVSGALLLALRNVDAFPADSRPDVLWATGDAPIMSETRTALAAEADLDAVSGIALRAVIDHYVPA
jgi:hypothetical protein